MELCGCCKKRYAMIVGKDEAVCLYCSGKVKVLGN